MSDFNLSPQCFEQTQVAHKTARSSFRLELKNREKMVLWILVSTLVEALQKTIRVQDMAFRLQHSYQGPQHAGQGSAVHNNSDLPAVESIKQNVPIHL